MVVSSRQSRQEHEGSGKVPIQQSKWRHGHSKQASISGFRNVINTILLKDHDSYFESFLRKVVREEVEHKVQDHLFARARINQPDISGARYLQLCFLNKLPNTIFTLSNIVAEDESPLQIAVFDVRTQSVVTDGPLSSIKIEICALNGEFGSNGSENWTEGEFNANILRERDGKGPLLNGERLITLKNGVGCISKMTITDNSRWLRSGKFRLGAKVVQGANIKEGRSEPFVVKDNRGEAYKKHYPPSLNDDIWRLEKIGRDGKIHKRLSLHGIEKVKDLLQLYITNPSSLYEKCGNIPRKSWLAITEHAKACVIDDCKLYSYHTAEQPMVLLFNSVYILVGVTFDGQNYCSPDTLTPDEKHMVENVKQHAYKNVNNMKPFDGTSLDCSRPATCLTAGQFDAPGQVLQEFNMSTEQGHQETCQGYNQPFISASYIDEGPNLQIHEYPLPDTREILPQNNYEAGGDFFSGMYDVGDSWHINGPHFSVVQSDYPTEEGTSEIEFINGCPPYTIWKQQENAFFFGSCDIPECSSHSPFLKYGMDDKSNSGKHKAVWYKILTALNWVISVKRDAAARKKAKLIYCTY